MGDLYVVRETPEEVTKTIQGHLKQNNAYDVTFSVTVRVVNTNTHYIMFDGAVTNPGKYLLRRRMIIIQAITMAGGFSPDAVRSRITIFRTGRNGEVNAKNIVNYDDILLRNAKNIEVLPGDTIVVPSENFVLMP